MGEPRIRDRAAPRVGTRARRARQVRRVWAGAGRGDGPRDATQPNGTKRPRPRWRRWLELSASSRCWEEAVAPARGTARAHRSTPRRSSRRPRAKRGGRAPGASENATGVPVLTTSESLTRSTVICTGFRPGGSRTEANPAVQVSRPLGVGVSEPEAEPTGVGEHAHDVLTARTPEAGEGCPVGAHTAEVGAQPHPAGGRRAFHRDPRPAVGPVSARQSPTIHVVPAGCNARRQARRHDEIRCAEAEAA